VVSPQCTCTHAHMHVQTCVKLHICVLNYVYRGSLHSPKMRGLPNVGDSGEWSPAGGKQNSLSPDKELLEEMWR